MSLETTATKSRLDLLPIAEALGSVSRACKYLDHSQEIFYRYKDLFVEREEQALKDEYLMSGIALKHILKSML